MTATSTASSIDFGVQTDAKVFSEGDIYVHDEKLCVRNMPAPLFQNRNSSSVEEIKPLFNVLGVAVLCYRSPRRSINNPGFRKITKSIIRSPVSRQDKAIQNNENHRRSETNGKKNENNMLLFTLYLTNVEIFYVQEAFL